MKKILIVLSICLFIALPLAFVLAQETAHDTTHQTTTDSASTLAPATTEGEHAQAGAEPSGEAHGEGHGGGEKKENKNELPSIFTFLVMWLGHDYAWMELWAPIIFAFATSIFFVLVCGHVYRHRKMIPGKLQNLVEMMVEGMYNFIYSILGEDTKKYIPLLGTLFFYILMNNLWGIIPLGHSPSVRLEVTGSMALCVVCLAQYTGIRKMGFGKYLYHMAGEPRSIFMWVLGIIILFPIHLFGEFAVKPGSLALRLFGNITGEDILVASFVGLGVTALSFIHSPIGLPFNVPFIFLGLLLSTIQALVFTLLSTIYILMMLPHEEHAAH